MFGHQNVSSPAAGIKPDNLAPVCALTTRIPCFSVCLFCCCCFFFFVFFFCFVLFCFVCFLFFVFSFLFFVRFVFCFVLFLRQNDSCPKTYLKGSVWGPVPDP